MQKSCAKKDLQNKMDLDIFLRREDYNSHFSEVAINLHKHLKQIELLKLITNQEYDRLTPEKRDELMPKYEEHKSLYYLISKSIEDLKTTVTFLECLSDHYDEDNTNFKIFELIFINSNQIYYLAQFIKNMFLEYILKLEESVIKADFEELLYTAKLRSLFLEHPNLLFIRKDFRSFQRGKKEIYIEHIAADGYGRNPFYRYYMEKLGMKDSELSENIANIKSEIKEGVFDTPRWGKIKNPRLGIKIKAFGVPQINQVSLANDIHKAYMVYIFPEYEKKREELLKLQSQP